MIRQVLHKAEYKILNLHIWYLDIEMVMKIFQIIPEYPEYY